MQLNGWQIIAMVFLGSCVGVAGALLNNSTALIGLAGTIIGGVIGIIQGHRDPATRSRATDRRTQTGAIPTAPLDRGGSNKGVLLP